MLTPNQGKNRFYLLNWEINIGEFALIAHSYFEQAGKIHSVFIPAKGETHCTTCCKRETIGSC